MRECAFMPAVPSRETLAAITEAVNAVTPAVILGFAHELDAAQVQVLYSFQFGVGALTVPLEDVPDSLRPATGGVGQSDGIASNSQRAFEWQLAFAGAKRLISLPITGHDPPSRLWIGLAGAQAPTSEQVSELEAVAARARDLLDHPIAPAYERLQLQRLELASGLLPALMQVLDIRDVFDQLSHISKQALPHDMLTLGLFSDDLTAITMYARTGDAPDLGGTFPQPYPPAVIRAREFDIVDDRANHPLERDRPPTQMGSRSSIRVQLRLGDRVIGGLGFMSFQPGVYSTADVAIARRLGDFVTVTLSHQRLAEQARHNEELPGANGQP